jgi:hypothetical protein
MTRDELLALYARTRGTNAEQNAELAERQRQAAALALEQRLAEEPRSPNAWPQ